MPTAAAQPIVPSTPAEVKAERSGYLPTLDGWRTIAIFAVIAFHAKPMVVGGYNLERAQAYGDRGVQLFFAISGILICSRLLEEQRVHGRISLRGFYLRRFFRIQPAAIVMLAAVGLLALLGVLHVSLGAMLASLLSYRNFFNASDAKTVAGDRYTVHFWSLAVEEHFYLLLPAILVFFRKRLVLVLTLLSGAFVLWPPMAHRLGLTTEQLSYQRTDLALQDLLVPALLAVLLTRPRFREWMTRATRSSALIVVVLVSLLVSELLLGGHITHQITCFGFPVIVASTMLHPEEWLGRLLETRPFTFFGRLSYSLYLWHYLFFVHRPETSILRYVQAWPLNLAMAILCALASYSFVEKSFIKLGHRFVPPVTPGREDLQEVPVVRRAA